MRAVCALGVALALAGCAKKTPAVNEQVAATLDAVNARVAEVQAEREAEQAAASEAEAAGHTPYPYTADQIAGSWVTGLVLTWAITGEDGQVMHQRWEVGETDDEGVTITYFDTDADGAVLGEGDSASNTWLELRNHASFPAERTTVEAVTLQTPFGEHPAKRYTVAPSEEGGPTKVYWFGDDTPGAPLLHQVRVGEELVMELKMTSRAVAE